MNELKVYKPKINIILTLIYPFLFILLIVIYLFANPLKVHAVESLVLKPNGVHSTTVSYDNGYGYRNSDTYMYTGVEDNHFYAYAYSGKTNSNDWPQVCLYEYNIGSGSNPTKSNISYNKSVILYNSEGQMSSAIYENAGSGFELWHVPNTVNGYMYSFGLPLFNSVESMKNYCINGDKSGLISMPEINIDMSKATYNSNIPIPKLVFNSQGGYKFNINNATDDYYIQIKGRWYTVDDITLYKEKLQWKYKYDTLLKGSLTDWVEPNEKILAKSEHDLCDMKRNGYGGEAFAALIAQYGIEQRHYSGGTNALGNQLSGYNDALTSLKELHLNNPLSAFNSPEIYIRFIVVNEDNSVNYGKWCHWYSNLANSSGSSGSNIDDSDNVSGESQSYNGLTDDELNKNEQQDNPRNDSDIYTYVNSDYIKQNLEISGEIANKTGAFFDLLNSMFSAMGQFPQMFKEVFMFLPPWFINFIIISMGAIIIARFIGR